MFFMLLQMAIIVSTINLPFYLKILFTCFIDLVIWVILWRVKCWHFLVYQRFIYTFHNFYLMSFVPMIEFIFYRLLIFSFTLSTWIHDYFTYFWAHLCINCFMLWFPLTGKFFSHLLLIQTSVFYLIKRMI